MCASDHRLRYDLQDKAIDAVECMVTSPNRIGFHGGAEYCHVDLLSN